MAVKKQEAAQAEEAKTVTTPDAEQEATPEKDTVVIHLFKDNARYKEPVFVAVNGEAYLVQRGVDVEVPKAIAEVLQHSEEMDNAAMAKIAAAEARAAEQPQRV